MHIAPPHQSEGIQSESEDSDYDTPPGDVRLSELTPSTTRLVMQSQTRAGQLVQGIQDAWTKVVQHVQCK